jgi:hypothetical protein
VLLGLIVVAVAWWAWTRTAGDRRLAEGLGATVAVSALIVLSPVGSHQYLVWLLPWVAISRSDRVRDWAFIATLSATATALYAGRPVPYSYWIDVVALGIRNASLVILLVVGIVEIRPASRGAVQHSRGTGGDLRAGADGLVDG